MSVQRSSGFYPRMTQSVEGAAGPQPCGSLLVWCVLVLPNERVGHLLVRLPQGRSSYESSLFPFPRWNDPASASADSRPTRRGRSASGSWQPICESGRRPAGQQNRNANRIRGTDSTVATVRFHANPYRTILS
jgi:hypothetical protein